MTHNGTLFTRMGRNHVPHVAHFNLLVRARARVLILPALMLISRVPMRPDALGGWHLGGAYQVCRVWGAYLRRIVRTPCCQGGHCQPVSVIRSQVGAKLAPLNLPRSYRRAGTIQILRSTHILRSTFYISKYSWVAWLPVSIVHIVRS